MEQWKDTHAHRIRERVHKVTGLPRELIYGSENMQVARYEPYGHYNAHLDTETHVHAEIPCCHQIRIDVASHNHTKCRICRYLTFLIYLNDVDEGGETAFPIADGKLMSDSDILKALKGNSSTDRFNLSHGCRRSNLRVTPKKGTAVMWYNHHVNETDGWLGAIDLYSIHGGCDVIRGEKWISNLWVNAPYGNSKNKPSDYLNWYDLFLSENQ